MKQKGIYYTIASALLFGITPLLTTLVYGFGANSLTVVFYRSLIVVFILGVLCFHRHISFLITRRQLMNIAFVSFFGSGLTTILLFASYEHIDTGTATSLHFLYPVFVALLCRVVYHERLGKQKVFALTLALFGMLLFLMGNAAGSMLGYAMAIASSITYAFYMVYLEKSGLAHMEPFLLSFYIGICITMETVVVHLIQPQLVFQLPPIAYVYLILVSICSSFLGVVWLQKGILYLGSSTASLFCLFEPLTSLVVGILCLQESLSIYKIIGSLFILIALACMSKPNKHREEIPSTPEESKEGKDKNIKQHNEVQELQIQEETQLQNDI